MNAVVATVGRKASQAANSAQDASDQIRSRYSKELVIALSGPVGCGITHVRNVLVDVLKAHGYEVVVIKISQHFKNLANDLHIADPTTGVLGEFDRIDKFQDLGNALRNELGDDVGAQIALDAIIHDRTERHPGVDLKEIKPGRVAYVIDQLKNPREAMLLRDVYGNLFYLIGVLSSYERRKQNLLTSGIAAFDAEKLIERDRAEASNGGQQLEKTLKLADYFVRNSNDNTPELESPLKRFVEMIHGRNGITPTANERGMYAAYSAALRSACLSRQVGASIVDQHGNLVSTGCNDVPKAGGGLYEAGGSDHRCVFQSGGLCFNDRYKDKLRDEITKVLTDNGIERLKAETVSGQIRANTRLKDLIEFSRAVHAEMDALIAAARRGGTSVRGCTLFTTTYPCHNCARHIVAAGIAAVYFIEPYGKSLASELHADAIDHELPAAVKTRSGDPAPTKVAFLHFEGVSPRRFSDLFYFFDSRKDALGKAKSHVPHEAQQKDPELLDNYRELESKVVQRLRQRTGGGATDSDAGAGPGAA